MTTIPVDLDWLILATAALWAILIAVLSYLATIAADHHYTRAYRKYMKTREETIDIAKENVTAREEAVQQREDAVLDREVAVFDRELALGRAAHDAATQTRAALYQANVDDTVIAMPRLEL